MLLAKQKPLFLPIILAVWSVLSLPTIAACCRHLFLAILLEDYSPLSLPTILAKRHFCPSPRNWLYLLTPSALAIKAHFSIPEVLAIYTPLSLPIILATLMPLSLLIKMAA
jgi:hypothetical protein